MNHKKQKQKKQMKRVFSWFIFIAVFIFFSAACGNSPPSIKHQNVQLNIRLNPESGKITASTLALVNVVDDDDNVENFYFIDEKNRLVWAADKSNWSMVENRGMAWTGIEAMLLPGGELPEAGSYRILVADLAGESSEVTVTVPKISEMPDKKVFPSLEFTDDGGIVIKSSQRNNIISFYNKEGQLLEAFGVTPGVLKAKNLPSRKFKDYATVEIACYNNLIGAGLITGPYKSPEAAGKNNFQ